MTLTAFGVLIVVALTILGSFIKNLAGVAGIPNPVPLIRDPILFVLCIYGIGRIPVFASRKWPVLIVLLCIFISVYLFYSMYEDSAVIGLYYLRMYLMPFAFFLGFYGIVCVDQGVRKNYLLKFLYWWSIVLFVVALGIYILLQNVPSLRPSFFGSDLLPTAWYISGGVWMRMGLPASGPNGLGLVFALNAFALIGVAMVNMNAESRAGLTRSKLIIAAVLSILGLFLTFSRSSMLLLFIGIPVLFFLSGVFSFSRILKFSLALISFFVLTVVIGFVVDLASDGFVARWLELNFALSDPSLVGHMSSIVYALDHFYDYALWGYPRGTVGPKAALFVGVANNVENSILGLLFDMGLVLSLIYMAIVFVLFASGYRSRIQLALVIGFIGPCMVLPYVFEVDALIYFVFIYLLLGYLVEHPKSSVSSLAMPTNYSGLAAV